MGGYRDALRLHQADINRLNVYPVPDGDTGTNMALTLEAVVSELAEVEAGAGLPEVCKAIGHGSLMGARGNSGVILSQLLRGLTDGLNCSSSRPGPEELGRALATADQLAREAVMRPVEGTILTVARGAAEGARGRDRPPHRYARRGAPFPSPVVPATVRTFHEHRHPEDQTWQPPRRDRRRK